MGKKTSPAKQLETFLNFIDECCREYQYAYDQVNEEDRKLQDFLHEMEFAPGRTERNQVAAKLQSSRKVRRENKNIVKWNEKMVKFFEEPKNRDVLNQMRLLLGQQRKEEEYLLGEKIYKPRVRMGKTKQSDQ